jgi:hypothetical protein
MRSVTDILDELKAKADLFGPESHRAELQTLIEEARAAAHTGAVEVEKGAEAVEAEAQKIETATEPAAETSAAGSATGA